MVDCGAIESNDEVRMHTHFVPGRPAAGSSLSVFDYKSNTHVHSIKGLVTGYTSNTTPSVNACVHAYWMRKRVRCTESESHPWMHLPSATGTGIPGPLQCQCTWCREGETEWLHICTPVEVCACGGRRTGHSLKCRFSKDQRLRMVIDSRWCRFHLHCHQLPLPQPLPQQWCTRLCHEQSQKHLCRWVHWTLWFSVSYSSV